MARHLEPAWDAPLDGETYLREVPATASIKGMFPAAVAAEAKNRGIVLRHASERYRAFLDYPLSQHMALLLEAADALWPEIFNRRGLRKMGRPRSARSRSRQSARQCSRASSRRTPCRTP